jgi:hypothetical protein
MKFLRNTVGDAGSKRTAIHILWEAQGGGNIAQIEESRITWFHHVKRMDKHRVSIRFVDLKISGKRSRGRPCT